MGDPLSIRRLDLAKESLFGFPKKRDSLYGAGSGYTTTSSLTSFEGMSGRDTQLKKLTFNLSLDAGGDVKGLLNQRLAADNLPRTLTFSAQESGEDSEPPPMPSMRRSLLLFMPESTQEPSSSPSSRVGSPPNNLLLVGPMLSQNNDKCGL